MSRESIKNLALEAIIKRANKKFAFSVIKATIAWVLMLLVMILVCQHIISSTPNLEAIYGGPRLLFGKVVPVIYGLVIGGYTFLDIKKEYYKRCEWIEKKHKELRFTYMVNGGL